MARRTDSQDEAKLNQAVDEPSAPEEEIEEIPAEVKKLEEEMEVIDDLELLMSGRPVPFSVVVDGEKREFGIKQMNRVELEKIRLQESIGYHLALAQPGMDELEKLPVSKDAELERALILAKLKLDHDNTEDPEERRRLGEMVEQWSQPDTRTRAEEIADRHSRRSRDGYIIDHFLVYPDGSELSLDDKKLFKRDIYAEVARPACWRAIRLATTVPN